MLASGALGAPEPASPCGTSRTDRTWLLMSTAGAHAQQPLLARAAAAAPRAPARARAATAAPLRTCDAHPQLARAVLSLAVADAARADRARGGAATICCRRGEPAGSAPSAERATWRVALSPAERGRVRPGVARGGCHGTWGAPARQSRALAARVAPLASWAWAAHAFFCDPQVEAIARGARRRVATQQLQPFTDGERSTIEAANARTAQMLSVEHGDEPS